MRYSFLLLLCFLSFYSGAQTDTTVIYRESYSAMGYNANQLIEYTKLFITQQKNKFFYINKYSKQKIDKSIDTSKYGFIKRQDSSIIVPCVFVYQSKSVDIVYGDIVFIVRNNTSTIQLQNVIYSKYEQENGNWLETQRGLYKDLKLCKHCSVTGIKLAETVNHGFIRLSIVYGDYVHKVRKK